MINNQSKATSLSLAALGVVFGDIGTSPLYAFRESLDGLTINLPNVLGILSLIFWALIFIISIKYLWVVFRADNDGEGGILSLVALLKRSNKGIFMGLIITGIFGAGLMLGDGMLTPAISVSSAVEGLHVISPAFSHLVFPITITLLIALFFVQSYGTSKIGFVFGPFILLWFITIAALGVNQIIHNPTILHAMNPWYAVSFFIHNGWKGYLLLGGIFLVVTGGEALFADLGHFGKQPIRLSWFFVVLPGLILNYFGQGAYILQHPEAIANPFYMIAPSWFSIPLLFIATIATIIASQAVISATFSIARQAILLGFYPHLHIIPTSATQKGQVYIPQINFVLAIGTLILVTVFKSSDALAHAYGIAVNLDMTLTSILITFVARYFWRWSILKIVMVFSTFLFVDLMFLGANSFKILTGGWLPVLLASVCAFIMWTWHKGINYLRNEYYMKKEDISAILEQLREENINKIPGTTAIFITDIYDKSGGSFLHFLKLNRTLPEHILIVSYVVENIPYVPLTNRFEASCLDQNVCRLILHYGFMDSIDFPEAFVQMNQKVLFPFKIDVDAATYFVEIPNIVASKEKKTLLFYWQEKIFTFFTRNYSANIDIEFYNLPYNRTMAIGAYCIL